MREVTIPLSAENLAESRERWHSAAIQNYDVSYRMHGAEYEVEVRGGAVTQAQMNGEMLSSADLGLYSMNGLFAILKLELENAADVHPRPTMRVKFDNSNGHLIRYVRGRSTLGRSSSIEVHSLRPTGSAALP